jgi:hypothetical protein
VMNQPPIPEGSIIITPTEVYNEVKSLTDAVRDLIAADKADIAERVKLEQRVDKLDTRLTAVERKMLLFTGAAAAAGAGVGTWLPRVLGA